MPPPNLHPPSREIQRALKSPGGPIPPALQFERRLPANLPDTAASLISRYMRYKARIRAYGLWSAALVAGTGLFLASILIDRFVELPRMLRPILPWAAVGTPVLLGLWALLIASMRRKPEQAASELDRAIPHSRDTLRSSLDFCRRELHEPQGIPRFFLASTLQQAETLSAGTDPVRILGYGKAPHRLVLMLLLMAIPVALSFWPYMRMDLLIDRFLDPMGNHPRPSMTRIEVDTPLSQSITQGDELEIRVQLRGRVPKDTPCTLYIEDRGQRQAILMTPRPMQRFSTVLREVPRPMVFYVRAGDGRSAFYRVEVKPRPEIRNVRVRYDYPRYTRLKPVQEELKEREFKGLEGTLVTVDFDTSLPVREGEVVFPDIKYRIRWDKSCRHGSFRFTIEKEGPFSVRLVADTGTNNFHDLPYRVRVLPDNPPIVTVLGFPDPPVVFREDVLDLKYVCSDDFGIDSVVVRAWRESDPKEPYEFSVPPTKGDPRKTEGSIGFPLADALSETDTRVRVELVAIDTKGQETTTARFELTVISETPDRLLAELALIEEEYLSSLQRGNLRAVAEILQAQTARLNVLIEAMDANSALDGKRKAMAEEILRNLRGVRIQEIDPRIYVTEYPAMSQKRVEYLMSLPYLLLQSAFYERQLAPLLTQPQPYQALVKLKPVLEQQAQIARDLVDASEDVLKEIRLRMVDCLIESVLKQMSVDTGTDRSEDYVEQMRQKQARTLEAIQQALTAVKEPEIEKPLTALQDALRTTEPNPDQLVRTALQGIQTALVNGGFLGGRLAARLESFQQRHSLAEWIRLAQSGGNSAGLMNALGTYLVLRRDAPVPAEGEYLLCAAAYEALLTADPARIAIATKFIETHAVWALRYELCEGLRQFRQTLHEMRIGVAVGRLRTDDSRTDILWQEMREFFLSIASDQKAGRFKPLGPDVDTRVARFQPLLPAFAPWSGRATFASAAFQAAADEAEKICVEVIAALDPAVAAEVEAVLREVPSVLQDVAAQCQKEPGLLQADRQELAKEFQEGMKKREALKNSPEELTRFRWTRAAPGRMTFCTDLVQQIAVHSMVVSSVLDFKEWLWVRNPNAGTMTELCAAAVIEENLKLLEEDAYRKAVMGLFLSWNAYPQGLEGVSLYYESILPVFTALQDWVTKINSGGAPALMQDKAFVTSMARFERPNHYAAIKKAWENELQFHTSFAAAGTPAAKGQLALAFLACESPAAYWDRLVLAGEALRAVVAQVRDESQKAPWAGIQPAQQAAAAAAVARIRQLLPDPKTLPDQAKPLMEAVNDWARVDGQIAPPKLAALPAAKRPEITQDLERWLEMYGKARENLADLVAAPVVRSRARSQAKVHVFMHWEYNMIGRMERSENRWTDRMARTMWALWSQRAQTVVPDSALASTPADADWSSSYEQRTRRKSAAARISQMRGSGSGNEATDYGALKMPTYLYEALMSTTKCPYPNQFKDPGTQYIQRLLREAR